MAQLPGLQAQQLKVISLNIHNNISPKDDGKYTWNARQKAVIKMIESENPDIIGVQDALLDQLAYIDKLYRDKYRRVGIGADNGITRGEHTAIYYDKTKIELASPSKTRWLSTTPQTVSLGWDARNYHIVTIAHFRVKATGDEFYYFNTHLASERTLAHNESIKLIAKFVSSIVPSGAPVIIGGDMNSEINNYDFRPLYDLSMDPARDIAYRTDYRNSYNGFGKGTPAMTDHFLVRNVIVNRFKTLIKNFGIDYISDHYPIMMIITL
ncbi:MAG: endonuclease [Bacteroidales bacterium]|nr:endonuclease [Bacteroidales bacterium]